jgi:hypothetical protein
MEQLQRGTASATSCGVPIVAGVVKNDSRSPAMSSTHGETAVRDSAMPARALHQSVHVRMAEHFAQRRFGTAIEPGGGQAFELAEHVAAHSSKRRGAATWGQCGRHRRAIALQCSMSSDRTIPP